MEKSWDHDLQLSIHCYYVGEFDTGLRASERILNSDAGTETKLAAQRNITFYAKCLSSLVNTKYIKLESNLKKQDWSIFNPTIIPFKDNYLALLRSSNYKIINGRYLMPEEDVDVIKTNYIQLLLDNNSNVIQENNVILPVYEKTNFPVDGLEDLRIFTIKDQYYVSGTIRNYKPHDGTCRIAVAKYNPNNCVIEDIQVICLNEEHQKNWMPISNNDSFKWIYHCNQYNKSMTLSVTNENKMHLSNCNYPAAKYFRGGSQLIKLDNKYYSIIHEAISFNQGRIYMHRLVEWSDSFEILRYSKPFYLKKERGIEFCAGACFSENNLLISFGVDDAEAYIASISIADMFKLFST